MFSKKEYVFITYLKGINIEVERIES
jgi:hypothetical protein